MSCPQESGQWKKGENQEIPTEGQYVLGKKKAQGNGHLQEIAAGNKN